jgi:L-ascorbate metabolism protein UlaG (beta-lactamase superfamily)
MARFRLLPDVALRVGYDDRTFFGSPVGRRPDEATRELFGAVLGDADRRAIGDLARTSQTALGRVVASDSFAAIAERDGARGWRVRPEVLYPDVARARLHSLTVQRQDTGHQVRVELPAPLWQPVHDLIAALSGAGHDEGSPVSTEIGQLLSALRNQELVELSDGADLPRTAASLPEITFAGHNTVVVRSKNAAVLLDPFLCAHRASFPDVYQPLTPLELGPVDAIVLTHSHPDHMDPGSLLRFGCDTHLIVPYMERETVLSVDMEQRVRQLGFERVTSLKWGDRLQVGDIEVAALPFYGEQPAEDDVLHPEVRNAGNTYVLRTPTLSAAFVADSGRDPSGDVKDVAREWRTREGPVDLVFSGYRGWYLYPAQLLFSSVSRFLLFVPPELWGTRQQLMTGVDDAIDLAERWGARYLVPYADGGAPWFWDIGLGARLDGTAHENPTFDPFPERVVEAARRRGESGNAGLLRSPVDVLLLRPGDSMTLVGDMPQVIRSPGHEWPYGTAVNAPDDPLP